LTEQDFKKLEGLLLNFNPQAGLAKLSGMKVDLVAAKSQDRRLTLVLHQVLARHEV
jgi:hypothetical protein